VGTGCLSVLLEATQRAISLATVAIVCCRREMHSFEPAARQLQANLHEAFPGLKVLLRPLAGMRPGEEGCPGSFEVLWEASDWEHSRRLHSRLASGKMPKAPNHGFHPVVQVLLLNRVAAVLVAQDCARKVALRDQQLQRHRRRQHARGARECQPECLLVGSGGTAVRSGQRARQKEATARCTQKKK